MTIQFFVPGIPAPGGSKTASLIRRKGGEIVMSNGRPLITMRDAGKNNKEWRATVALFARQEQCDELLTGPLSVQFEFFVLRPKSHYRAGDRDRGLKADAPSFPTVKPDALKLARSTEDALTGVLWVDDCQAVDLIAVKRYAQTPGARITISTLNAEQQAVETTQQEMFQPQG